MDTSHFENNFKQTINCPATRANTNEPHKEDLLGLSLLCELRYSTMEKLPCELLIYCYVANVTERRWCQ